MYVHCYITNLPPDHSKVLTCPYSEQFDYGTRFTIADNLVWGADTLQFSLNTDVLYDYCRVTVNPETENEMQYFYFLIPQRQTPATPQAHACVTFQAVLDYYGTYGDGAYIRGYLTQGHELLYLTRNTSEETLLPVEMKAGDAEKVINLFSQVVVAAKYTIREVVGSPNYDKPIIIYSPPFARSEEAVMRGYIGNMGTALKISSGGRSREILHVDGIYIVPKEIFAPNAGSTTNATLEYGDSGSIGVHWNTGYQCYKYAVGNQDLITFDPTTHKGVAPRFLRVGNMGSYVDIPFTGAVAYWTPTFYVEFNGDCGTLSATLRYGDINIDLLPSLSVPFGAFKQSTTAAQRAISDGVSLVTSALSLAGGIATGNPLAIAGGVVGVGSSFSNIATRSPYSISSVDGSGLVNTTVQLRNGNNAFINGLGIIVFNIQNEGSILAAVKQSGFTGLKLGEYRNDFVPLATDNKPTYRRFLGPITVYAKAGALHVSVQQRVAAEIEGMALAGYWLYGTLEDLRDLTDADPWNAFSGS